LKWELSKGTIDDWTIYYLRFECCNEPEKW
jgi:hypothetical protein